MNLRKEELEELFAEAPSLGAEAGDTDMSIEKRFLDLLEPLGRRKKQLELSKAKLQISRDLEDETVRDLQPTQGLRCQLPRGEAGCCLEQPWQQMTGHPAPYLIGLL